MVAGYAFLAAKLYYRNVSWREMGQIAYDSAILTAAVVFLLAVASVYQYLMGVSGVPQLLGQVLELKARGQTSGAIKALLGLAPKTARRISPDGSEHDVDLNEIHVGDSLRVRPGEKVPTDGVVIEGSSSVDESMVSG